jgi:hypothetical protein
VIQAAWAGLQLAHSTKMSLWYVEVSQKMKYCVYSSAPVSMGNTFQDLRQLCETTDNTERYIYRDIHVTNINMVKFN